MLTQTLARWLNKLFAWWPWKQNARVNTPLSAGSRSRNIPPEVRWRLSAHDIESVVPQPGNISAIMLEQQMGPFISDELLPNINQTPQASQKQIPPAGSDLLPAYDAANNDRCKRTLPLTPLHLDAATNTERHLQFLRFLVQRGAFNDDLKR